MRGRWQVGENRRVLYGDLLLVVIAICDPSLNLGAIERSGDKPLMEGMPVMIALVADGAEPGDEARAGGRDLRLELRFADRRRQVCSHFSAERTLLKVGAVPARTWFFHAVSLS